MDIAAPARRAPLLAGMALCAALLGGCVNLGGAEPPASLLTLTPAARAPAGAMAGGQVADAILVIEPETPQRLAVPRVPVQQGDASLAYLKDAVWVERPARLFGRLVAETIRAGGKRLVLDGSELQFAARTKLSGQLTELGYDAPSASVIVRFDAVLQEPSGEVRTRRFEAVTANVTPEAAAVGPALNAAANRVAAEIAAWVG
jgi:cholesterol transport system auxiliary component